MLPWLVHAGVPSRSSDGDSDGRPPGGPIRGLRAASIVCQRAGADPPTLAELGGW